MIYLDNAATSFPKPDNVYNEVIKCMKNYAANPGRSSHDMSLRAATKVADTRSEISSLFNIDNPLNIVFTMNATEAINIALMGLLSPGDHAITTAIEHNSVLRPLSFLGNKGVEVSIVPVDIFGDLDLKILEESIKKNTKLIIVNHGSNVIGTIQDLNRIGKIAKRHGVKFMVDASQTAGVLDIDVKEDNIDLLAFPGHKSLLGMQGTGALYVDKAVKLKPFVLGGTGSNSSEIMQPEFMPDKFESGTLNTPGIVGLEEGIRFIKKVGIKKIRSKEEEMTKYLVKELNKLKFIKVYGQREDREKAAVVSINLDNMSSSKVGYLLNKKDIAVRTGYHCAPLIHEIIGSKENGTVRISIGYFNTFRQIEKLIDALKIIHKD